MFGGGIDDHMAAFPAEIFLHLLLFLLLPDEHLDEAPFLGGEISEEDLGGGVVDLTAPGCLGIGKKHTYLMLRRW